MSREARVPVVGLIGTKVGMSQVFDITGNSYAVTLISVEPNLVVESIEQDRRGYTATALGVGHVRPQRTTRALAGKFSRLSVAPRRFIREIRDMSGYTPGELLSLQNGLFTVGSRIHVTGTSKGKGFAGPIKRHNQAIGPRSHGGGGGSKPIRQVGSMGDISGNKVFKGMKMPGHMGVARTTIRNLEIVHINEAASYLLVKGAVPGPRRSQVIIWRHMKPWAEATQPSAPLVWHENLTGSIEKGVE